MEPESLRQKFNLSIQKLLDDNQIFDAEEASLPFARRRGWPGDTHHLIGVPYFVDVLSLGT